MKIKKIPVPEIYKSSADFRFFMNWVATALEKIQYDIENLPDIYDPLRCPEDLLWCLADTMGYKFDDRLPTSFNRLVLLYFMQMIYNRGSRNGMILAAQTNLAQFPILEEAKNDEIKYNRLESVAIPTNAVSVIAHVDEGYIDVVYFSTEIPKDACVEYVRPVGMYAFQRAGVAFDSATTKIYIDAELTNATDYQKFVDRGNPLASTTAAPTQVGHYRRSDYASLQKMATDCKINYNDDATWERDIYPADTSIDRTPYNRNSVWSRNSAHEGNTNPDINPGFRALQSLQLANNEHIVQALIPPIFTLGEKPLSNVEMIMSDDYYKANELKPYNLRYDITTDEQYTPKDSSDEYIIYTIDKFRSPNTSHENSATPMPSVNPAMAAIGDAISVSDDNSAYIGEYSITTADDFLYNVHPDGVTLLRYIGDKSKIQLPATIEDTPVTAIAMSAFTYNETVTAIKAPRSITIID